MKPANSIAAFVLGLALSFSSYSAFANDPLLGLSAKISARHKVLIDEGTCQADTAESSEIVKLKQGMNLYLIPCYFGAYQGVTRAYMSEDDGLVISEILVLQMDETSKAVTATADLGSAAYDAKTRTLSTFAKGRGLGDCGQSSVSKILVGKDGGFVVKTIEIRDKESCDGQYGKWPVVFKQK